LQLVRDRWSIEGWHWIRDSQLHADAHRYSGNRAGAMATLRTAALTLLRLDGFQAIRTGMQANLSSLPCWRRWFVEAQPLHSQLHGRRQSDRLA
jgi:hypothetical protein